MCHSSTPQIKGSTFCRKMKLGFDWQFREARLGEASACDAELGSTHKKWPEHNAGTCLILFYLSIGDPEGGLSIRVLVCTHSPPLTLEQGQPTKSVIQGHFAFSKPKIHTTCECCSCSGLFGSGIDNVQLCAKSSGMMRSKLEQKIHGFKEDVKEEQTD